MAAVTDPAFRDCALHQQFHEHAETVLVQLTSALPEPCVSRLLHSVLAAFEDLEVLLSRFNPAVRQDPMGPVDLTSQYS